MKGKENYTHMLKYIGVFGGVQGINIGITLIRNKFVALILGPAGMGLVSLFNSVINFFSQATNLGISFSAVRNISEIFDKQDTTRINHFIKVVRGWSILTALVGMLAFAIFGPLFSKHVFASDDHTLHFILLSPVVAMLAIIGGENAILKGARMLKPLAGIQLMTMVATLLITVPVYYFFRMNGIVPVIIFTTLATMVFTLSYSVKAFPYSLRGAKKVLGEGTGMVRLGVAFVLAGVFGSGSELAIRSFLNVEGDLDVVGLYNAGYLLTITYAGMVFSAMDTDYFPRLSAIASDNHAIADMSNCQIEISLLLVSPMLAALIVFLPIILPILYSHCFIDIVAMGQIAVFSMYFKAITLPLEYINLAKGNSKSYLGIEIFYDVIIVFFIVWGYRTFGLWGTGLALSFCHLLNLVLVIVYSKMRYGVSLSTDVLKYVAMQLPLGMLAYATTFIHNPWIHWTTSVAVVTISLWISLYIIIYKKTSIWNKIKKRFVRHG